MFKIWLYSPRTQYSVIQSSKFELNPTQKPVTKNRTPFKWIQYIKKKFSFLTRSRMPNMTILKHRAKQKLYDIASTYQRHISLSETPTLSYSLTCFSRNNNDDPMMPFNLTIDSSITTCVIRECNIGAQSRINTLANCNHDEHDRIWNEIVCEVHQVTSNWLVQWHS